MTQIVMTLSTLYRTVSFKCGRVSALAPRLPHRAL